jgi:molybdopterin molybdotransferase
MMLCMSVLPTSGTASQSNVLSFEDARRVVQEHASRLTPTSSEISDLLHASGRILAEPIYADRDIPPFPRSTRDGYAVRSADLSDFPSRLTVEGEIKAGPQPLDPVAVETGQAFAIMTGAPLPSGADAVVMVEFTSIHGEQVEIQRKVAAGQNVVPQGAEAARHSLLLEKGDRLNEAAIALAASVGKAQLKVFRRPRVSILTTGDEIVPVDAAIGPSQIRNSNSYSLAAQIQQAGGVSMGRYDLVEPVMAELRAEFFFTGAKIQPGRPVVFGRVPCPPSSSGRETSVYQYFFGLPGNPVSTMVTFELFARPLLEALAGATPQPLQFLHARSKASLHFSPGLKRFLPALLSGEFADTQVEAVPWQGSGDIAARSRANCYLVVPDDRDRIAAGEWVSVMLPR